MGRERPQFSTARWFGPPTSARVSMGRERPQFSTPMLLMFVYGQTVYVSMGRERPQFSTDYFGQVLLTPKIIVSMGRERPQFSTVNWLSVAWQLRFNGPRTAPVQHGIATLVYSGPAICFNGPRTAPVQHSLLISLIHCFILLFQWAANGPSSALLFPGATTRDFQLNSFAKDYIRQKTERRCITESKHNPRPPTRMLGVSSAEIRSGRDSGRPSPSSVRFPDAVRRGMVRPTK